MDMENFTLKMSLMTNLPLKKDPLWENTYFYLETILSKKGTKSFLEKDISFWTEHNIRQDFILKKHPSRRN